MKNISKGPLVDSNTTKLARLQEDEKAIRHLLSVYPHPHLQNILNRRLKETLSEITAIGEQYAYKH